MHVQLALILLLSCEQATAG